MKLDLEPTAIGAILAGVALAYLLFQRGRAWPWGRLYRATDAVLATSITRTSALATRELGRSPGALSRAEVAELEAFYVRWLNLPREEREELRNELLLDQIDMIRLGDALRWYRDAPP